MTSTSRHLQEEATEAEEVILCDGAVRTKIIKRLEGWLANRAYRILISWFVIIPIGHRVLGGGFTYHSGGVRPSKSDKEWFQIFFIFTQNLGENDPI